MVSILDLVKGSARKGIDARGCRVTAFVFALSCPIVVSSCGEKPVEPTGNSAQSSIQSNTSPQTGSNLDPQTGLEKEGRARAVDVLNQLGKIEEENKKKGIEPAPEKDVELVDPYNDADPGTASGSAESGKRMPSPFKKSE
ncbi:MAG: hypothetical protein K2W95_26065 [Candidatus Obscuribacterales bacterium]|nr:hypothetical protein [Candidatus Obscuribacterales bacterium]